RFGAQSLETACGFRFRVPHAERPSALSSLLRGCRFARRRRFRSIFARALREESDRQRRQDVARGTGECAPGRRGDRGDPAANLWRNADRWLLRAERRDDIMATVLQQRVDADRAGVPTLPQPYLLFLGDTVEPGYAKTAFGLADWAADRCVGEWSVEGCTVTTGLPPMAPPEARAAGARWLVIGVANQGGVIGESWVGALIEAMEAGLDIVSGLHARLASVPALAEAARRTGRRLIDVRTPPPDLPVGNGRKRSGKRLLTVGTDCALGKKYTALALHRAFLERGIDADFRATGQTGIMIAGGGMPMDAVVSDFEAG